MEGAKLQDEDKVKQVCECGRKDELCNDFRYRVSERESEPEEYL